MDCWKLAVANKVEADLIGILQSLERSSWQKESAFKDFKNE